MPNAEINAAKLLILRYRQAETESAPIGIICYSPSLDTLHFRLRTDYSFVHPDEMEIVAGILSTLRAIVSELGARATFLWLESSLSNTIFVEGPMDLLTADLERTVQEVYERTISISTRSI